MVWIFCVLDSVQGLQTVKMNKMFIVNVVDQAEMEDTMVWMWFVSKAWPPGCDAVMVKSLWWSPMQGD